MPQDSSDKNLAQAMGDVRDKIVATARPAKKDNPRGDDKKTEAREPPKKDEKRGWWDKLKDVNRTLSKPLDEYRKGGTIRKGKLARLHKGERATKARKKGRSKIGRM